MFRYALRALWKRRATSAVVVLTMALGLGANAAVFGLIDALVLRPFPIPDVDRIVMVAHTRDGDIDRRGTVSAADFLDIRDQTAGMFERLAAFDWWDASLVGRDEPERVQGFRVSADFFPAMGVRPHLGRVFLREEETHGRHLRVVLGYGLWQRRFASDASVIGRTVQVDGAPYEVVGIAPRDFDFPMGAQIWAPLSFDAEASTNRKSRHLTVIGRLAEARTLAEAKAQVALVTDRLAAQHPDTNKDRVGRVYTLSQGMLDVGLGPILSMWQASACFVLLIACANVANLLLARGAERQREFAVRLAIGASPWRVARGMLTESVLLAIVSVPAALGVAWISLTLLRSAMPANIARFVAGWDQIGVDSRLVVVTLLIAVGTGLLFGLVPALQGSRTKLGECLKDGGRSLTTGVGRSRLRRALVMAEMALALPLLVASGLSAITVHRYLNGPQGHDPDGVLTMRTVLPDARYPDAAARLQFAERVVDRLQQLPGVQSAAVVNIMPSAGDNSGRPIELDGLPHPDPANLPSIDYRVATPAFFATLRIPIVRGRGISDADRPDTQPVAIVSESLARKYWPDRDPIGQRIRTGTSPWLTVVGVSGDVIQDWFSHRDYPTVYRPFAQAPSSSLGIVLRAAQEPATLSAGARAVIRAEDAAQPVFDVMTMRQLLKDRTLGLRYVAAIMGVLGALALVLSIVGVYAVIAYLVTQRRHEIGVRIALGATRADVLRLTIGQTGRLTAVGVGAGAILSFALTRLIEAGLLGVATNDPRLVGALALVLVSSALLAGYLPSRRATRIDPIAALREQ